MNPLSGLLGAVQFLTRVPIRTARAAPRSAVVPWFPVVGALVGAVVAGTAIGAGRFLPSLAAAALAVCSGMLVTGAFHEDGLADTADALAGGSTAPRRRQILDDSRLGTYGTAALCGSILLRTAAIAALLDLGWRPAVAVAVAAHAIARVAAVALIPAADAQAEAARDGKLGAGFATATGTRAVAAGIVAGVAISAVLVGWWTLALLAAGTATTLLVRYLARRAFGLVSGDHLGCAEQLAEIGALLVGAALAANGGPWWA